MATQHTINWNKINPIVKRTMEFLRGPHTRVALDFLRWYNIKSTVRSQEPISSPAMTRWIIDGIPKMRNVINALGMEQNKLMELINRIYSEAPRRGAFIVYNETKGLREGEVNLRHLIVDLLGCRGNIGDWYLQILKYLALVYPQVPTFRNVIPFFEGVCQTTLVDLLNR